MFVVMLCLIAVIASSRNWLSGRLRIRIKCRAAERRLQAQWSRGWAHRAAAQLARTWRYTGESGLCGEELGLLDAATVEIRVTSSNKMPKAHNIEVTADFSARSQTSSHQKETAHRRRAIPLNGPCLQSIETR